MSGMESLQQLLPTLIRRGRGNAWFRYETMDVYLRVGPKMVNGVPLLCLQLANLQTQNKRQGIFTRLVKDLTTYGLPLYLERVLSYSWREALERHGWEVVREYGYSQPTDLIFTKHLKSSRQAS